MKKAFTLAEVLITLGIIGVVAVLTLPSLIARYKEKVLLSQIKKSYSNLLNVVNLYRAETGDETYSGLFNPDDTADVIAERFTRYYKTTSVCTTSDTTGKCALYQVKLQKPTNNGHGKLGYEDYGRPRLFLSDGSSIYIRKYFSDIAGTCGFLRTICVTDANGLCTAATITYLDARCGILGLDVNGLKSPNQYGADVFQISVYADRLIPMGSPYGALDKILETDKLDYKDYNIGGDYQP